MRLIDADALLEVSKSKQSETEETAYNFLNCAQNPSTEWDCVEGMIENAPTIEAEPVRRGRWKKKNGEIYCTNCKKSKWSESFELMLRRFNFCPNCAARMDGGADNG